MHIHGFLSNITRCSPPGSTNRGLQNSFMFIYLFIFMFPIFTRPVQISVWELCPHLKWGVGGGRIESWMLLWCNVTLVGSCVMRRPASSSNPCWEKRRPLHRLIVIIPHSPTSPTAAFNRVVRTITVRQKKPLKKKTEGRRGETGSNGVKGRNNGRCSRLNEPEVTLEQ